MVKIEITGIETIILAQVRIITIIKQGIIEITDKLVIEITNHIDKGRLIFAASRIIHTKKRQEWREILTKITGESTSI